jgi:hypothetical protein
MIQNFERPRRKIKSTDRLLKNAHLRRCPHPSSLRRTPKYASLFWISGALHLDILEQPAIDVFINSVPTYT